MKSLLIPTAWSRQNVRNTFIVYKYIEISIQNEEINEQIAPAPLIPYVFSLFGADSLFGLF